MGRSSRQGLSLTDSIQEFLCGSGERKACGDLGQHPVLSVISFALLGFATGIGLTFWEPANDETKETVLRWIGVLGDLFVRALQALVLPLVFVNVVLAVADMSTLGNAERVGKTVVFLFLATTIIASLAGALPILSMHVLIQEVEAVVEQPGKQVRFGSNGMNPSELPDGTVLCSDVADTNAMSFTVECNKGFVASDHAVEISQTDDDINGASTSDIIYDGIFKKLVPENIAAAFVEGSYATAVVFAVCFGAALSRVLAKGSQEQQDSNLVHILREINEATLRLIDWVLILTPFAVFSLNAEAVGSQDDLLSSLEDVGWLILAMIVAVVVHFLVSYIGLYALVTMSNPFVFIKHLVPAMSTAFASCSGAAALPVALRCVKETGKVPDSIKNFVLPLGLTINLDGSAIYLSCATLWLAYLNGMDPSVEECVLLVVLSVIGSIGAAPIPFGTVVVVLKNYKSVFGSDPQGYEMLFALDWFFDGLVAMFNITGDAVVAGMVAARDSVADEDSNEENDSSLHLCEA